MARYSSGLRGRSAKPVFVSSNLTLASIKFSERNLVKDLGEDYEYFLNGMKNETNYTLTENGALTHKTTTSDLLDMFALGASMRKRSDEDVLLMFQKAYRENPLYALKCLFYIRDVRGGQGERRFFRVCMKWLANNEYEVVIRNLKNVPEFGRWDDLYVFDGTAIENEAYALIKEQLALDVQCKLLLFWLSGLRARIPVP